MNFPSKKSDVDATSDCCSQPDMLNPGIRAQLGMCEVELLNNIETLGPDHLDLVDCLTTLGLLYQHMARDYLKALYYHHEALRILVKYRDEGNGDRRKISESIAVTLTDLAFIYESHSEFQCALANFTEAKRLLQSINTKESDHKLLSCLGGCDRLFRYLPAEDKPRTSLIKRDEFLMIKMTEASTSWRRNQKLQLNSGIDLMPANYKLGM